MISWPMDKGLHNNNCIECFFGVNEIIHSLKDVYLDKYGYSPEIKAGIHGGKVVVTWVGELKKEILYLGDVMNTTARIMGECNRLSQELLISGEMLDKLESLQGIQATFIEAITLRGKKEEVRLFGLSRG